MQFFLISGNCNLRKVLAISMATAIADEDYVKINSSVSFSADKLREKFLQCNVCYEEYDEDEKHPRLLPCLHTYCFKCLQTMIEKNAVVCPTCRVSHRVGGEDVSLAFPKDNTRRDLMDFVRVQRAPTALICNVCTDKKPAVQRCIECAEFLCEDCTEAHKRTSVTKDHSLPSINELKQKQNLDAFCHPQKCKAHDNKPLEMYCTKPECLKPICFVCALVDHKETEGHKHQYASLVSEKRKREIDELNKNLIDTGKGVEEVVKTVDDEVVNVGERGREVECEIDAAFDNYIKILERRRSELKERIGQHVKNKTVVLEKQLDELNAHKNNIEEALQFSEQALAYTNPSAFLQIDALISSRLERLIHHHYDKVPHQSATMGFVCKGLASEIQTHAVAMANVWASSMYQPKSMIKMHESHAFEKELITFQVELHDFQDKKLNEGLVDIKAIMKDPDGIETEARIDDRNKANGYYIITTVPFQSGSHLLEVRVMGKTAACMKIDVKPSRKPKESKVDRKILKDVKRPVLLFDREKAHKDVTVSPDGTTFLNSATSNVVETTPSKRLQKYKGVMGNMSFKSPGVFYYEINSRYRIRRPLEKCNLVFEVGLSRQDAIDNRHHVEGQPFAWSLIGAHHNDCDAICLHIAHGNQCLYHKTLSKNEPGNTMEMTFGFLLDTTKGFWKVFDCEEGEQICVIDGIDTSEPLWPVVAGYNPYQVDVTMNMRTNDDATK